MVKSHVFGVNSQMYTMCHPFLNNFCCVQPPIKYRIPKCSPGRQLSGGIRLIYPSHRFHHVPIVFVNSDMKKKFQLFFPHFVHPWGESLDDVIPSSAWYQRVPLFTSYTWVCGSWYSDVSSQSCLFCRNHGWVWGGVKKKLSFLHNDIILNGQTSYTLVAHIHV